MYDRVYNHRFFCWISLFIFLGYHINYPSFHTRSILLLHEQDIAFNFSSQCSFISTWSHHIRNTHIILFFYSCCKLFLGVLFVQYHWIKSCKEAFFLFFCSSFSKCFNILCYIKIIFFSILFILVCKEIVWYMRVKKVFFFTFRILLTKVNYLQYLQGRGVRRIT